MKQILTIAFLLIALSTVSQSKQNAKQKDTMDEIKPMDINIEDSIVVPIYLSVAELRIIRAILGKSKEEFEVTFRIVGILEQQYSFQIMKWREGEAARLNKERKKPPK